MCALSVLAGACFELKRCLGKSDALKRSKGSLLYRHIKEEMHREEKHTKKIDVDKHLTKKRGLKWCGCSVGLSVSCSIEFNSMEILLQSHF